MLCHILVKCRILSHSAEMSRFTLFAGHKMSAPRHLKLFCTPLCNNKKQIVRDDNYERHAQHLRAFQQALLINMFHNHIKITGVDPSSVKSRLEVQDFLTSMMMDFGAIWYWDVEAVDPMADRECQLFKTSRDQVIRLALDLAFRQAEHQNDAMALRALRRIMAVIFCANSTKSKYALYTLLDLVGVESQGGQGD